MQRIIQGRRAWKLVFLSGLLGLMLALSSCTFPGMVSTNAQLPAYVPVGEQKPLPPVQFPQDEGSHNNLTEWWYYTGHFNGQDGHRYGFEFVIFQVSRSDLPPLFASHFAISDITRGQFAYDQRNVMLPLDNSKQAGINVGIGDWRIQGFNGHDHLEASMKDYAIKLDLNGVKAPTLHDGKGLITYGLAGYSYYYSRTRMQVSGTLLDHGQPVQVNGQAWMDHQWGNFLTLGSGGWDWYSIQLSNGADIMIYFIRDAMGKVISTYVGYTDDKGQSIVIPQNAVQNEVLDHWLSPHTGINYPSGWRVSINDPRLKVDLTLTPQLKDQELVVTKSTGNVYWEGAVDIQGQQNGQSLSGLGYVELTGYTK
ncbi:carotenoid 1,2-hydratase [Ktedonobacter sp. SOSP1-52]|uniref:lipocalin-like domain-containing protein n=1 Tax=Ktedonobacter sp. SOSP1-52 TaxID=2778366 RepID=UPI001916137C|nr:lipocalin-like domain-containing protein [Ktedonobacter sp. SOSP1-52]GHO65676.1 carotenoid 1,2-hydratase [Ktedonobacter sp. SOSP1-52]